MRKSERKQLKKALEHANRASKKMSHNYVGTEHLLIGLIRTKDSLASKILVSENVDEAGVVKLISELIQIVFIILHMIIFTILKVVT